MWHDASCWAPYSLGQNCKKELLSSGYARWGQAQATNGEARPSGLRFNITTSDKWNKAGCFTLLKRITRLKNVNSEVISKIHSFSWEGIPRRVHATVTNPAWITCCLVFVGQDRQSWVPGPLLQTSNWKDDGVWRNRATVRFEKTETENSKNINNNR